MAAGTSGFTLDGVGLTVGGRPILADITLDLACEGLTALIGHNGSGKSTLLDILSGQTAPTTGQVQFAGRPIGRWPARDLARHLALLPQATPAAPGMLVHELVALGRFPWHGALGRFSAADRRAVDEAIALTGIGGFVDRQVDTLSGGERQRVWMAMMIAQDASCWLLDEPTSALDIAHQAEVLGLIRDLARTRGFAAVLVLHDINMAADHADRIVALRSGRVIADDTPARIMTPAQLRAIYGIEMEVTRSAAGRIRAFAA
ncbi:MAG: iron ABC transporter substrate-binding protein [Tistrella sp.]|uniref:Iron ABC transporter substrate-binding protein n=1 Tax=Tistrella mobilis TaxID=171437 RepID=A0A3B9IKL2_9PROT|nr:ATP-binding cassette domain-containing protein [Tistrella sp.]MAD39182.1 iron ABC transporter substrate-binding protein [Tistrella sp.]MBA73739.1 iron ABC transporter substrate-binding protein [Tistrella sp.]HAE48414.1 iron ABC transporter substrate-binding protein [Tistrella mobilis]